MTHQPEKLTQGPLGRQMVMFSIPLVLSNLLQVLFNMSDLAVVGRFAGAQALGSVGSTTTLVHLFTGFLIGLGSGVNVLAARYYGADNRPALRQTVHTALMVCFMAGLIILALGQIFSRGLLTVLRTRADLMDGASLYLRIYFLGMPAMAVYNYGNAVFSAVGDTKRPLIYLSVAGALNVALNLFFVIACHMDVAGVAMASVISQYISAALILAALFRSRGDHGLQRMGLHMHKKRALTVLQLGIPAGVQSAIFAIANLFIQSAVNSFDSAVVEGNAAAANADLLIYNIMNAFYVAGASFISQNFGAGKKDRILKSYYYSMGFSFAIALVLGLASIAVSRPFMALFATDEAVIRAGAERITIMGGAYCVSALMDATTAASRGLGKTFWPVVFTVLGSCVFRIAWVYTVFAWYGTFRSLYLVYVFSWAITSVAQVWYFFRNYKRQVMTVYPEGAA